MFWSIFFGVGKFNLLLINFLLNKDSLVECAFGIMVKRFNILENKNVGWPRESY